MVFGVYLECLTFELLRFAKIPPKSWIFFEKVDTRYSPNYEVYVIIL